MNQSHKIYAEDLPYWDTTTTLASNQDRIERELDKFGADGLDIRQASKGDMFMWYIRFEYASRVYRFDYMPFPVKKPNSEYRKKPRLKQAIQQMAARAYHEIKAVLTGAAFEVAINPDGVPRTLFGYLEAPGKVTGDGLPPRMSDMPIEELCGTLTMPALPAPAGQALEGELIDS